MIAHHSSALQENPTIYLGDRGFLKRYGSTYTREQIQDKACEVLEGSELGLASGDWVSAMAISKAVNHEYSFRHCYHSRFLIRVFSRLSNTYLSTRQVQGARQQYMSCTTCRFFPDKRQIDQDIHIINHFKPGLISVGGDWLDILLAQGEINLAREICEEMQSRIYKASVCKVLLTFNLTAQHLSFMECFDFCGVLVPINIVDRQSEEAGACLDYVKAERAIYALHCLAGGVIALEPALDYAFNHVGVRACIVGARQSMHINELMSYKALHPRS